MLPRIRRVCIQKRKKSMLVIVNMQIFLFHYPVKSITTGEGGMLVTNKKFD